MARPSDYTLDTALEICERLVNGQSLRTICSDEAMPAISTVFLWLQKHREFSDHYARAREAQADTLADEILDVADNAANDWMDRKMKDGSIERVVDQEHIGRSKLRVDARKWIASKLKPKKYGERMDLTNSDGSLTADSLAAARARSVDRSDDEARKH